MPPTAKHCAVQRWLTYVHSVMKRKKQHFQFIHNINMTALKHVWITHMLFVRSFTLSTICRMVYSVWENYQDFYISAVALYCACAGCKRVIIWLYVLYVTRIIILYTWSLMGDILKRFKFSYTVSYCFCLYYYYF